MKLRNKKTGEVFDALIREKGGLGLYKHMVFDIKAYEHDGCIKAGALGEFNSLAELNEEWEDVKEPLIKDPRIRKAVRAWAEANDTRQSDGIEKVFFDGDEWEFKFSEFGIARIQFNRPLVPDMEDKEYTITELCGEEL